jgi:hypothetical protein
MARWRDLEHALPGFILAGRLAGLDEKGIQAAWVGGDREAVIERALNPKTKRAVSSILHHPAKKQDAQD